MGKNYYDILGVRIESSPQEINDAFRGLLTKYNADMYQGEPEHIRKKMEEIHARLNEAFSVLSDSYRRARYDEDLAAGRRGEWHNFDEGDRESGEAWKKKYQESVQSAENEREELRLKLENAESRLRDEQDSRKRSDDEVERRLSDALAAKENLEKSYDKTSKRIKSVALGAFALLAVIAAVIFISLGRQAKDYKKQVPVSLATDIDLAGLYVLKKITDGQKTSTAELTKDGTNAYTISIYSDGPIIHSSCRIVSDGTVSSELWGSGTITRSKSGNKVVIRFTPNEHTVCELVN